MKFLKLFLFLFFVQGIAQDSGFHFLQQVKKTTIPFQFIHNLIFIPVEVNGVPLTFLLDSGVAETILFSVDNREISFKNAKKTKFRGLGGQTEVEGIEANGNKVKIGKNLIDSSQRIYIILDESFNISSHIGIPVNGVIGYQFFRNCPVQIDYVSKKITFYNSPLKAKNYEEFPLRIEMKKPYIETEITDRGKSNLSKMLLDLGNSDALWIFPNTSLTPDNKSKSFYDYLGRGFNGDVYGTRSRIKKFKLGNFSFPIPTVAVPDATSLQNLVLVANRSGSVGDEILRRFHLILDYPNEKIYIKKNRNFSDPFYTDLSGLTVRHNGLNWESEIVSASPAPALSHAGHEVEVLSSRTTFQYKFTLKPEYVVAGVRDGSPAGKAGLQKGDKIISISGRKASEMTLEKIMQLLKSEPGKKINIIAERDSKTLKYDFILEDPIPYMSQ